MTRCSHPGGRDCLWSSLEKPSCIHDTVHYSDGKATAVPRVIDVSTLDHILITGVGRIVPPIFACGFRQHRFPCVRVQAHASHPFRQSWWGSPSLAFCPNALQTMFWSSRSTRVDHSSGGSSWAPKRPSRGSKGQRYSDSAEPNGGNLWLGPNEQIAR